MITRFNLKLKYTLFVALSLFLPLVASTSAVLAQDEDDSDHFEEISDPIEPVNRGIFWFNDVFDIYIFEPVAEGYDYITPHPVQKGIGNFFNNIRYPKYFVSSLVQGKVTQAMEQTGRFLINTTVGLLGTIDVAKEFGLEHHSEDMGIALAYHGVGTGPYLVLPFLGPSNLRDGVGRIADFFLDPFVIASYFNVHEETLFNVGVAATVVEAIDTRAGLLDAVKTAKESSVDYYGFMQSAYYQHRRGVLYDGNPPDEEEGGLERDEHEEQ